MTRITSPYRGRAPTKRLDLTDMRSLFRDPRIWCAIGRVTTPDGAASHFEDDGTDIRIDVILQPSLQDVTCRLGAALWVVPAVGEEVVVGLPDGALDFMPVILGILSTNVTPTAQQSTPGRIAIVRQEVVVHDGAGGAVSLAYLTSLQATVDKLNDLISKYSVHTHPETGGTTGPPSVTETSASSAEGTTVLKGK